MICSLTRVYTRTEFVIMIGSIVPELMLIASLIIDMTMQFNVNNQRMKINLTKKKEWWAITEPTKEEVRVQLNLDTFTNMVLSAHNN